MISCTVVFFAISFLTPVFYYIPKPALAAMIMAAVITMVDTQVPREIWKIKRIDMIPYAISFFGTFYQLEAGVLAGAVVALLIMVSREVHPKNDIAYSIDGNTASITLKDSVSYPGVEYIKDLFATLMKEKEYLKVVTIDMSNVYEIDYAVLMGFKNVIADVAENGMHVQFINFIDTKVKERFLIAGLEQSLRSLEENDDTGQQQSGEIISRDSTDIEMGDVAGENSALIGNGCGNGVVKDTMAECIPKKEGGEQVESEHLLPANSSC